MITYTNHPVIENKTKVARRVSLGGLAVMLPGLFFGLGGLFNPTLQTSDNILISYVSLIAGTIVATMGGRMAERWLVEPRDDQKLEKALKGLDKRYRLINYHTAADHVLLTPTGLYAIVTKDDTGPIRFDGKRWSQPPSLLRLWHDWRHGGLGNPTAEADAQIQKLQKWLKPRPQPRSTGEGRGEGVDAPVKPLIVFTKPEAALQIANGHDEIVPLKDLKAYLQQHTTPAVSSAIYRALADAVTPQGEAASEGDEAETESKPPADTRRRKRRKQKEIN